jgi:hypothetical protein
MFLREKNADIFGVFPGQIEHENSLEEALSI